MQSGCSPAGRRLWRRSNVCGDVGVHRAPDERVVAEAVAASVAGCERTRSPAHAPVSDGDRSPAVWLAHKLIRVEEEVIPVLYVQDAGRAVAWYGRLGFHKQWEHQFEEGFPWFVSVARGRVRLYLSEHKGDAGPNTLIHLNVADIDAVAEEFGIAVDEEGLAGRECDIEDPDGNRLRIATPRP